MNMLQIYSALEGINVKTAATHFEGLNWVGFKDKLSNKLIDK